MEQDTFIEVKIYVNSLEKNGVNNQVKLNLKKFFFGLIEYLIWWRQDLDKVWIKKMVVDLKSKFNMTEMFLDNDPLETFNGFMHNICHMVAVFDSDPLGGTNETFTSIINRWLMHYSPHLNKEPTITTNKYMFLCQES